MCRDREKDCKENLHKNLIIKKVKKLAEKNWAENGIIFRNWQRESFIWKKEEYNENQNEAEQELYPNPDMAAEFSWVGIAEKQLTSSHDGEDGNKNEEAAESEWNCDLGELWNSEEEDGTNIIGNPDEPEMLEIVEGPLNNAIPENLVESEDEIENQEQGNPEEDNYDENNDKMRNNKQKITGMDNEADDNDGSMLRRGKRKRVKNPRCLNKKAVNMIMSNEGVNHKETT